MDDELCDLSDAKQIADDLRTSPDPHDHVLADALEQLARQDQLIDDQEKHIARLQAQLYGYTIQ